MMSWLLNPESELVMIQGKFLFRHYHLWLCGCEWVLTSSSFRENDVFNSNSYLRVASNTPWMYIWKALGTWHIRRTQTLAVRVLDTQVGVQTVMPSFHCVFLSATCVSPPRHTWGQGQCPCWTLSMRMHVWTGWGEALRGSKPGWCLLLFVALLAVSCLGDHWQNSSNH